MAINLTSGNAIILLCLINTVTLFALVNAIKNNARLRSSKQSFVTKFGKYAEQFMAVLDSYPYDRTKFRFIGSPIDGVQFELDKIVFVEFKTGEAELSERQRTIKQLIEGGRVEWKEIRIPPR